MFAELQKKKLEALAPPVAFAADKKKNSTTFKPQK